MAASDFEKLLKQYDYELPPELIANRPATPRDSARLLVYDRKTGCTHIGTFAHIADYLPKGSVIVFNKTKVIPARLILTKETTGSVPVLYLGHNGRDVRVLASKSLYPNTVLSLTPTYKFRVKSRENGTYILKLMFASPGIDTILERYGKTPIPPYIKHSPLSESQLRTRYQSMFARVKGSVAAPTASLHFTPRLVRSLERKGFQTAYITLHVNIGTFAPLREEQVERGELHEEFFTIDKNTATILNGAKQGGKPVIAVGTTVLRTLESATDSHGRLKAGDETTRLFIREGYIFKFVDGLITNFHVPRSSLLMLVAALIGRRKVLELYRWAIKHRFRFFSFGDGMLIV